MPYADTFRGNKLVSTKAKLVGIATHPRHTVKNKAECEYALQLCKLLTTLTDPFTVRVESPLLNIYTNIKSDVERIASIDPNVVKVIYSPNKDNPVLEKNTIIVKSLDFGFKVHMASTNQSYPEFLLWSENNSKIRLTKLSKAKLGISKTHGGYYFYVKDAKSLTVVKMFLGSNIRKIETIIKA
jgi:hypothetical protein